MLGHDATLVRVRHFYRCRATMPSYRAPPAARRFFRVPSARTFFRCAFRLGCVVFTDDLHAPRSLRLSPEEASVMRLSAVAPDALLEVALSIQQALCDVLAHHSLLENAYRQHIAGLEDELASASHVRLLPQVPRSGWHHQQRSSPAPREPLSSGAGYGGP